MPTGLWLMFGLAVLGFTGCDRESTPVRQNHPSSAPSVGSVAPNSVEARVLKIMSEQSA
jgi:hypothetical protein